MIQFFSYMPGGLVVGGGRCFKDSLQEQGLNGAIAVEGSADAQTQYYLDGELLTYTDAELAAKNNLPQGWIWQMPERIAIDARALDDAKRQAWERVKLSRAAAETSDFLCNGDLYQSDKERISGAVQMALLAQLAGAPFSIDWTLANNSVKTLDAAGMIAVGMALGAHINSAFDTGRALREQINTTATTIAQVDAIDWSA